MTHTNVKNLSVGEIICKERNFLDEITIILNSVSSNLQGLFLDFASIPTFACLNSELETLQHETQNLRVNITCLISTQLQGTQKAMSELHKELVFVRSKYNNLQNEWDKQQEHLGKMQTELFQIRKQLEQQCQFCSSLGAVMGNLVWKTSRIPLVVDMLLAGNKVTEFLSIVNGSLVSFMETYSNAVPNQCADESQFIMSFCGIVTNIAAAPAGRQFIASNPVGKDLIEQMIRVLPLLPTPSGNCLKRLLLMALYNLSINQNGLKFLQQQKSLQTAIAHDLQIDSTFELKLMSLRLLHCLTYDIPSCTVLNNILIEVPIEVIQALSKSSEPEMRDVVKDIQENINHARKKFEMTLSSEIKNKSGYDESIKTASGGQNCQAARHVSMFQHPAQYRPFNKCLQKL